jgi:hypothetical protein
MPMLDRYLWTHRLLLLFVPEPSSPEFVDQWTSLYRHQDALAERDLLVLSLFAEEVGDVDGEPIEPEEADALRQRFRVKPTHAAAVLVGKDGTEKKRWPMPLAVDALLATIDAMPMRQQEKRDRES